LNSTKHKTKNYHYPDESPLIIWDIFLKNEVKLKVSLHSFTHKKHVKYLI